jgi:hypothetical protein
VDFCAITIKTPRESSRRVGRGRVLRLKGRRFTLYIPEDLVPEVRRCLDNGRALQELLFEAAPRYVKALKRQKSKLAAIR